LAAERVERRLAAVLAADVAGYSRLMGIDEEGTLARLKAIRKALVDPTIATHRGRIVKTTGDGVLVEFASAVDAVRGAVEVQRGIAEQNASLPQDRRIEFRIGIHVGDIIIDENDIFGDGVNIAARLEGIAEAGGICISDDAHRQIRTKVDFAFNDLGPQSLKNIAEPMRAWRMRIGEVPVPVTAKQSSGGSAPPLALPERPSIAVLPFQNMSGDPEQEYFADGMVEDIITALSRFKALFVIARNSSFSYRGKSVDIKQVGRELGVQYVLEGSVRRVGDRVRITGQLIDATAGSHAWADRFDGTLDDVFEMQDRVTASVVGAIVPRMAEISFENVGRKPVESWGAYEYYLRGMSLFHQGDQGGKLNATLEALPLFRKAVQLNPTFARAHVRIAASFLTLRDVHGRPISEDEHAEALRSAEQAVRLAGDDEVVLMIATYIFGFFDNDYERGSELIDRALALNPNFSHAWNARGIISVVLGNHERALNEFAEAMRLNPLDNLALPHSLFGISSACILLGRYEEGAEYARKMLALAPNDIRGLFLLTGSTSFAGKSAEANDAVARIKKFHPHMRASFMRRAYRVRQASDMAVVEQIVALIGLPE
jgi:TolB-like protein/class 3 adenylate cyclase